MATPHSTSNSIKQVYDASTDTYHANQGLLLEVDLLSRYKEVLDYMFHDNMVGLQSIDALKAHAEHSDAAQKIVLHYPILGKNLIRSLLAERIRNYIDRTEYRRTT